MQLWVVRCSNVISFKLIWRHMKLLRLTVLSKIAILLLLACLILFVCIYDTPASISLRAQLFWMIFMCSCGLWDAAMSYPFNLFKGIRNCFTLQPSLKSQFCYFLLVWYYLFEFMSKKLQRFPAPFLDTTCSLPVKSSLQIANGWRKCNRWIPCCCASVQ